MEVKLQNNVPTSKKELATYTGGRKFLRRVSKSWYIYIKYSWYYFQEEIWQFLTLNFYWQTFPFFKNSLGTLNNVGRLVDMLSVTLADLKSDSMMSSELGEMRLKHMQEALSKQSKLLEEITGKL